MLLTSVMVGCIGIFGNGLTLVVLCSSASIRRKTVNMFLISQSSLDFLCALLLIITAWDVVWSMKGGYFGVASKVVCCDDKFKLTIWGTIWMLRNLEEYTKSDINIEGEQYSLNILFYSKGQHIPLAKSATIASTENRDVDCFHTISFKSVGMLKCYLWDSKVQLWSFISSSTYNLVALNVERWLSLIFPGNKLQKW